MMFNHIPGGGNVLYLDGHVEFVRFDEKHPLALNIFHPDSLASTPGHAGAHNALAEWLHTFGGRFG